MPFSLHYNIFTALLNLTTFLRFYLFNPSSLLRVIFILRRFPAFCSSKLQGLITYQCSWPAANWLPLWVDQSINANKIPGLLNDQTSIFAGLYVPDWCSKLLEWGIVGLVTLGTKVRAQRYFSSPKASKPDLEYTRLPVYSTGCVSLITHLRLVSRLRMSGAITKLFHMHLWHTQEELDQLHCSPFGHLTWLRRLFASILFRKACCIAGQSISDLYFTYIHTRTCIHTYIQTYIHTHTSIYIHTHTHVHAYIHTYMHTRTYKHTYVPACIHTCIHINACIHTYVLICT
jgi:hypothetical protein